MQLFDTNSLYKRLLYCVGGLLDKLITTAKMFLWLVE